jgi:hypothetical protein
MHRTLCAGEDVTSEVSDLSTTTGRDGTGKLNDWSGSNLIDRDTVGQISGIYRMSLLVCKES